MRNTIIKRSFARYITTISALSLFVLVSLNFTEERRSDKFPGTFTGDEKLYRGNTHTHAEFSDENDKNDVPEIAGWYRAAGYDFLLLSEHNDHLASKQIFCHEESAHNPDFIMLCGLELSNNRHCTALGIDRFIGDEKSLQDGVKKTLAAGGIPILNHPQDPVVTAKDFIATKGLSHLEILNGGRFADTPATEFLWDSVLSDPDGRIVFAVASDDNHYKQANVGKGWIMVMASALTKEDIEENIRSGNFYATTGIILKEYFVSNNVIKVDSENGSRIRFSGRQGEILKDISGSSASYKIKGNELYIRVKVTNDKGMMAWTQPLFLK